MTLEEVDLPVELWACHLQVFNAFVSMGTQWRVGAGGPTGLDYAALPVVLRLQGIPRSEWPLLFEDLRVMEDAALAKMHKKKS